MRLIYCNECGKFLFETEKESNGAAGAEAQEKGFVFKMPILFSDEYSTLFFCNDNCGKLFYQKHIPKNQEASKKLSQLKSEIPDRAKEICMSLNVIQNLIKNKQNTQP